MSAPHRHDYRHYKCNSFARPSDHAEPTSKRLPSSVCDLDNDIHPLFRPTNFPAANYEALRPALQLASLLIDTDCLLDFWHAAFFGERRSVHAGDDEYSDTLEHIAYFRRRPKLSAKDRAETRLKLLALAEMVTFNRDQTMLSSGRCSYVKGRLLSDPRALGIFQYSVSYIRYNEGEYQQICKLFDDITCLGLDDDDHVSSMQRSYFFFAHTLLHELAHAAVLVEIGGRSFGFFEDETIAEDGFAWENHIYGGLIRYTGRDYLVMAPWPDQLLVNFYFHEGITISAKCDGGGAQPMFYVPLEHICQFFTFCFWDTKVRTDGAKALKPTKEAGFRQKYDEAGDSHEFALDVEDEDRFDGIPEGWYANGAYIYPIDEDADVDVEGFGRLMKINREGIRADDRRLDYLQGFMALPDPSVCDPDISSEE